jgi:hypothetical protein
MIEQPVSIEDQDMNFIAPHIKKKKKIKNIESK